MKILVTGCRGIPGVPGGVETHCQELYPPLAALGVEVTVACRRRFISYTGKKYRGVRLVRLPSLHFKGVEAFLHTLLAVFYAALRGYPLVHIHGIGPGLMVPLARLLGRKVVFTTHGPDYLRPKWGWFSTRILHLGEALGCRYAHRVIAVSHAISAQVKHKYGREDVSLIKNGCSLPEISSRRDYIHSLGLQSGEYILSVGRFEPEKGFHDLLEAYSRLKQRSLKLVLAGNHFRQTAYCRELSRLAAASGCLLPGFVRGEALAQLYSHARVFVLPSYLEGLSLAFLEALGYGLEMIVSSIPANREVTLPESCYFPPGDVEALCARLEKISGQPACRQEKYREMIKKEYDWETLALRTLAVYKKIRFPERIKKHGTCLRSGISV